MADGETTRLVAWGQELRRTHVTLRRALNAAHEAVDTERSTPAAGRDLLLYCRGFCVALEGHHRGEQHHLFPAVAASYPRLRPVLEALEQDHAMIASLLDGLQAELDRPGTATELGAYLEGVAAIMENHFLYEERQLLTILETLDLSASIPEALGPL